MFEREFLKIIRLDSRVMAILKAAREVNLPHWYVGAGVIRRAVWDYLHGRLKDSKKTPFEEVDLIYYTKKKINEKPILVRLESLYPKIRWDLHNDAYLHEFYRKKFGLAIKPLASPEEDVDGWPETATCVAVRLMKNNHIKIYAPYGLEDLLKMIFRVNPKARQMNQEIFQKRLTEKKIREKWPKVKAISP